MATLSCCPRDYKANDVTPFAREDELCKPRMPGYWVQEICSKSDACWVKNHSVSVFDEESNGYDVISRL